MVRVNLHRALLLYLTWLGFIAGGLIVLLADLLPFADPERLFVCFLECQIFFVILVWPFFTRSLETEPRMAAGAWGVQLFIQIAVLLILSLPLALICFNVANASTGEFLAGQGLVAALAAFVAALHVLARGRDVRLGPWYFLAAFVISGALPFLAFFVHVWGGPDLSFFSAVSPFWGASLVADGTALVQAIIYGGLAAGLLFLAALLPKEALRKEVDAPSPAA